MECIEAGDAEKIPCGLMVIENFSYTTGFLYGSLFPYPAALYITIYFGRIEGSSIVNCPLFFPIPHRSCRSLKTSSVGDRHTARTSGTMHHQQAAQPVAACGDADVFILRIEHQVPRLYFVPLYVHAVGVLLCCSAALSDHIRAAAGVVERPIHE